MLKLSCYITKQRLLVEDCEPNDKITSTYIEDIMVEQYYQLCCVTALVSHDQLMT